MESVIAAVVGLVVGVGMGVFLTTGKSRKLSDELDKCRRRATALQEQSEAAKRDREQTQKNVDAQLRTKDLQLKQLRDESEHLKQQLESIQSGAAR